jgi:hypothetical protein
MRRLLTALFVLAGVAVALGAMLVAGVVINR